MRSLWFFSCAALVFWAGCNEPIVAKSELGPVVSGVVARVMTEVAAASAAPREEGADAQEEASRGDGGAAAESPEPEPAEPSEAGELGVYEEEPPVPDAAAGDADAESLDVEPGEGDVDGAYPDADAVIYEESENAERIDRLEVDRDLMAAQIEALEAQVAALDQRVYDLEELSKLLFATVTTHQQRLASIQVALLAITAASGAR